MAIELSGRALLVRPHDHVILGIQWWGLEEGNDGAMRAGADAGLVVTLPPQHLAETAGPLLLGTFAAVDLSGPSRLVLRLPAGATVDTTVDGLLAAMDAAMLRLPLVGDDLHTVIELPYGLRSTPAGVGTPVHVTASTTGGTSSEGTVGLWQAHLRADDLRLSDLHALTRTFDPPELPLGLAERTAIADATSVSGSPAVVERLDLSCLGGSLCARGDWEHLDWSHDAALGRDQHVRFAVAGLLFPLGHRAVYVEQTDRTVIDDGTGPAAPLTTKRTLIITEPHRDLVVADDARLDRQFPFDAAEITSTVFEDLAPPIEHPYRRETVLLADLQAEVRAKNDQIAAHMLIVQPLIDADRTLEELTTGEAAEYKQLQVKIADLERQILSLPGGVPGSDRIDKQIQAKQAQIEQIMRENPQLPEGGFASDVQEQIRSLQEQIDALRSDEPQHPSPAAGLQAEIDEGQRRLEELWPSVESQLTVARSIEEVALAGSIDAQDVLRLRDELSALEAQIARIDAEAPRPWIYELQVAPGQPLRFPVRCSSPGRPDVRLELGQLFVATVVLPADDLFVAFDSRVDKLDAVAARYEALRQVPVPGAPIDVVRAGRERDGDSVLSAPGDVVEVHAMALAGVAHAGRFVPQITELQVGLPALRALLGDAVGGATRAVRLSEALLSRGPSADVVLDLVEVLDIDFRSRAEVSGGLTAPRLLADGISRLNGPVSVAGLVVNAATGRLDPFKVLGEGASLLGFDLRDLIAGIDVPPTIVQSLLAGQPPSVTMEWTGVELKDAGPFVASTPTGGAAQLDLVVTTGSEGATTQCRIKDFSLHLPPGEAAVLILSFDAVQFTHDLGRAPDLQIRGIAADFVGDLRLLEDLQRLLDLGSQLPVVTVTPAGISARYGLDLPSAGAGVFQLRNVAVHIGLDVPFVQDLDEAITVSLGFASRKAPFNLSVLFFGGGGYVEIVLDRSGLRRFELSLEFGASASIDFLIASAEVHALGGVRALVAADTVTITGFLRFGGSIDLLGLVSVSVELVVALRYEQPPANRLVGRATLVIEVDLTLYSDSFELDSGEWELVGGDAVDRARLDVEGLAEWRRYRAAFADEEGDGG